MSQNDPDDLTTPDPATVAAAEEEEMDEVMAGHHEEEEAVEAAATGSLLLHTPRRGGGPPPTNDDHQERMDAAAAAASSSLSSSPVVPPTPLARPTRRPVDDHLRGDQPEDDDEDSLVPPTPADRRREGATAQPMLTPLSDDSSTRAGEFPNDPREQQRQQQPPRHDDDDDDEQEEHNDGAEPDPPLILDRDLAHIRGTDVHVPTAAAAFVDFLRNFKSLRHTATAQRQHRPEDDDVDDDDTVFMADEHQEADDARHERPWYLSRLEALLTQGHMMNGPEEGTIAATASLEVDVMHLYYHSPACQKFHHQLVAYPMELVPLMDILVQRELERLAASLAASRRARGQQVPLDDTRVWPRVQVRPYNLRVVSNLRCLDPVDMDSLVAIKGMIVRSSPIIPDLKVAHFSCCICGHAEQVAIDRGRIAEPNYPCPDCATKNSFQLIHNRSVYADKQLVRLQETPDEVPAGQTPASVVTFCYDDLVDSVQPGDKVEVTGVLRAQPVRVHPKITKVKAVYKTYLDVIHFRKISGMETTTAAHQDAAAGPSPHRSLTHHRHQTTTAQWSPTRVAELMALSRQPDIYEKLTASLAPSIWELDNVKKGVLCMLFGGNHVRVRRRAPQNRQASPEDETNQERHHQDPAWLDEDSDEDAVGGGGGARTSKLNKRGDINILLCGDPGTSKSQLLSYVNKLSSRGVYTSGKGSSAVGLTASVVRDPETRELVLESGALVLSDLGICCIDEFDKMSDSTRSVLHEAMEQQTVSVAKAGIIAQLRARTSILASANPTESRYNPSRSVVDNIQLPPTLLSRFDLIYLILDHPQVEQDRRLAQHLVGLYNETPNVVEPPLDQALLRDYIEYARQNIHPEISDEASEELISSYLEMRNPPGAAYGSNGTRTISATPRQLESLIRLSEALAKMRYSNMVSRADVREAVRLIRVATQAAATDPRTGRIDMDMITTGRSSSDREMEEALEVSLKELVAERRGQRMAVRDVNRQLSEVMNVDFSHDVVIQALRRLEADGSIQLNERAQTLFVRSGIVR